MIGLAGLGGYWYLRNAVTAGNPLPSVAIHLGPLSLPAPHVTTPTYTIAQYVTNGHIWRLIFIPGLRQSLGLAWWALIAGAAGGSVGVLLRGRTSIHRVLGAVTILSGIAFVFTPQFLGIPGLPIFFSANVRYGAMTLALGLVLLPTLPAFRSERRAFAYVGVALAAAVATALDPGVWPIGIDVKAFGPSIHGGAAIAGALLGALIGVAGVARLWAARMEVRRGAVTAAAAAAVVAVRAGGLSRTRTCIGATYGRCRCPVSTRGRGRCTMRGSASSGSTSSTRSPAPTTRTTSSTSARPSRMPGFESIASCRAWRAAVDRGRYRYVLVTPFGFPLGTAATAAPEFGWTGFSPAAHAILRETNGQGEPAVVYRLSGPLNPDTCPST